MWLQAKKSACSTMTNPASSDSKITPEPRTHLCDLRKENGPREGAAKVVAKS
jgi:hypothetical protein